MLLSVVMEDRVVLFALTHHGLRIAQRRIPRERLVRTVRWLAPALAGQQLDEHANAAAALLSDLLIEPFDDLMLAADVLYVVADPLLQSIPYSFLPLNRASLQRLVDRLPIVMCPSASACLGESSPASPTRNGTVAILRQRDGDYLPRLDWEVSRIATLYPRASVVDATAARFTRELGEADILHYAGHAFVDPGFSKRSALLLRRDDNGPPIQIAVDDLITGPIHTRLIVLSACSTLRGREFRGEGMVAASTAFLAAGARNVVGTLWDVRDDAASALIVTFHEQLARGVAPARALWLAQRRAKRDGRPPRDWAFPVLITHDAHSM
jgi:CHAT domain-containing protein